MKIIPSFKPAISYKQLNRVLFKILSGSVQRQEITRFEHRFAGYIGTRHAIRVPSGRWGLYYILQGLNLKEGDEVILPAFTYFAIPAVIIKLGLRPVFVDINPWDLNIDIQRIKENISDRTRVIIPTHLCGFACKVDEILDIARQHNIKVIEDCAQSLGAGHKGKKAGSLGTAGYFTFSMTKGFTTLGGGMITTDNDLLADNIRRQIISVHPTSARILFFKLVKCYIMKSATSRILFPAVYWVMRMLSYFNIDIVDVIFREKESAIGKLPRGGQLDNIRAGLGIGQLKDLDRRNEIRMKKGVEFYEGLKDIDDIRVPLLDKDSKNIFSGCPILFKNKKDIKKTLLKRGIDVSVGYMQDCARLDIFKEFKKDCPNASRAEDEILYFPLYTELTPSELTYIINMLKAL